MLNSAPKPEIILEVGTWLGGGSTLHFLEALALNQVGHLYGVEADSSIYQQMLENLHAAVPDKVSRFTPLFGTSRKVIPRLLHQLGPDAEIDIVFLDGGDNPNEQVQEFQALANRIRVGGTLFAHDTKLRKGKWLLPYLKRLDNWNVCLLDISEEGMLAATKLRDQPSSGSRLFATIKLFTLRLEPVELIGAVLPKSICALFLRLLPERMRLRLSQGRK